MDHTLELSMTELEMQFDSMDDFDDIGAFDVDSEMIPSTEVLDMKLRAGSQVEEVDELNTDIGKRGRGLPEHFGRSADDIDGFFED